MMDKRYIQILLISLITMGSTVFGQTQTDPVEIRKNFGTSFLQNGKRMRPVQLLEIVAVNTEAYEEMKKAKANYNTANLFGLIGGGFIGYPLGTAAVGGEPNMNLALVGLGFVAISIPFSSAYVKRATKAVNMYNNGLNMSGNSGVDMRFGLTGRGIGMIITF